MSKQELLAQFKNEHESLSAFGNDNYETWQDFNDYMYWLYSNTLITLEFHNSIDNPY